MSRRVQIVAGVESKRTPEVPGNTQTHTRQSKGEIRREVICGSTGAVKQSSLAGAMTNILQYVGWLSMHMERGIIKLLSVERNATEGSAIAGQYLVVRGGRFVDRLTMTSG